MLHRSIKFFQKGDWCLVIGTEKTYPSGSDRITQWGKIMVKIIKLVLLAFFVGLSSACATMSSHMTVQEGNPELKPEAGKALLVFMRPSSYGGAVQATIYDDTTYIGTISANTKIAYQADPGPHMFMVIGESADFMQADLKAGKTYYARVSARMGFWKARFSFNPENGGTPPEELNRWLTETKLTTSNETGKKWAEENKSSIMQKHAEYLPVWKNKDKGGQQILHMDSGK